MDFLNPQLIPPFQYVLPLRGKDFLSARRVAEWKEYEGTRQRVLDVVVVRARRLYRALGHTNFRLKISIDERMWLSQYDIPGGLLGDVRRPYAVLVDAHTEIRLVTCHNGKIIKEQPWTS